MVQSYGLRSEAYEVEDYLLKIIVGLLTVLTAIIGWNVRGHKSEHDKLKEDHAAHKLNVSENYAKKTDLNAARMEINDSIRRLHEKIEEVDDNLDKKITEIPDRVIRLLERANK